MSPSPINIVVPRTAVVPTIVFAVVFGVLFAFGEKIPVGKGYGYDGVIHGTWAEYLSIDPNLLSEQYGFDSTRNYLDPYTVRRLAPATLVHITLKVLGIATSRPNVIACFVTLDWLFMTVAVWLWFRLAQQLRISKQAAYIGMFSLFATFPCLKFFSYYPVLTDPTAYFLAILLALCWVEGRSAGLLLTTIFGAFTHQFLLWLGLTLFCLPYEELNSSGDPQATEDHEDIYRDRPPRLYAMLLASVASCVALIALHLSGYLANPAHNLIVATCTFAATTLAILCALNVLMMACKSLGSPDKPSVLFRACQKKMANLHAWETVIPVILTACYVFAASELIRMDGVGVTFSGADFKNKNTWMLWVGVGVGATWVYLLAKPAIRYAPKKVRWGANMRTIVTAIVIVLLVRVTTSLMSSREPLCSASGFPAALVFYSIATIRIAAPGVFVVAHAVFFGPLVFLIFLRWSEVWRVLSRRSPALFCIVVFGLLVAFCSESRCLAPLWPFIVIAVVQTLDTDEPNWWEVALFGFLSICYSKVWLPFNAGGEVIKFRYQMNHGLYMNAKAYVGQAAVAATTLLTLWVYLKLRTARRTRCLV